MRKITKQDEQKDFISLNKETMSYLIGGDGTRGGVKHPSAAREDRMCNGGCGNTAAFVAIEK